MENKKPKSINEILEDKELHDGELFTPVDYYFQMKGKNVRGQILHHIREKYFDGIAPLEKLGVLGVFASSFIEKYSQNQKTISVEKAFDTIADAVNLLHNASLVIDDIQDESVVRRKQQTAHLKYGLGLSLNAGYLTIFRILNIIGRDHPTFLPVILDALDKIHVGQGFDIYYTQHQIIPSIVDYVEMMKNKTGCLFTISLDLISETFALENKVPAVFKRELDAIRLALNKFAIYFQIRDDYINLCDPKYWQEKGFCQDFDEQKMSYIMVKYAHSYLRNDPTHIERLIKLHRASKNNIPNKVILLKEFHESGLFNDVFDELNTLKQEVLSVLNLSHIFEKLSVVRFDFDSIGKHLSV